MDILSELISVCAAANTDKITERKKQIEKLQQLLTKGSILKALDKHSALKAKNEKRNSQLFAWDNLFSVTRRIFEKEVESLRKLKEATTATTQTNRDKKKQECSAFVKTVVRLADKRGGQNLKAEDVAGFVLHVLRDEYTCVALGMDLSTMLFKHVLSVRRYWADIAVKTWHEMMNRYCKLLQDPPPKTDRFVIARLIYVVMVGAAQQCDIRGRKLLPLLDKYFTEIKNESSNKVVEQMMSTLCVVTESLAVNGRVQVCRLGESLLVQLLFLWKRRCTELLKEHMVEFLRLQMRAHHPRGAATEETGAYAVNWDDWKSDLKKLYEAIYNDLQERTSRSKFSTGGRDVSLKENYVDLAVDVCHQLFRERTSALDVTQAAILQTQPGGAAKRRRVESGWGMLSENVTHHAKGLAIPWLQLILGLVTKCPASVPEEEVGGLLGSLQGVQAETKHPETLRWVLRCLRAVARCQKQCGADWCAATRTQVEPTWTKVWAATLRTLSLHQAEEAGYALLSSLIEAQLVIPDTNLWTLFLPAVCPVSQPAVSFITHYLQHLDLHERYRPALLVSEDTGGTSDNYPLRHQLLSWMFPATDQYEEDTPVTAPLTAQTIDPRLLAETAVVLTLRDTRSINVDNRAGDEEKTNNLDFETVYLQTSFDLPLCEDPVLGGTGAGGSGGGGSSSSLNTVHKHLIQLIERDSQTLLESTEKTMQAVEMLLLHCAFLVRVLGVQLSHSVVTKTQLPTLPLFNLLKQLMKRASAVMTELLRRERSTPVSGVLTALSTLLACDDIKNNRGVANVVVGLTPATLIDQLLDLAKGRNNAHNRSAEDLFDLDPLDDDDFGPVSMDVDNGAESQEDDGFSTGTSAGRDGLLSPRLLTDAQQERLEVVRVLCRWSTLGAAGPAPEVSPRVVVDKLLDMLDEEAGWDPTRAYDLQLLRAIVEELTVPQNSLEGNDIHALAVGLWSVGRSHRRDQEICGVVLGLVTALAPHLSAQDGRDQRVDPAVQEARETCLQLVSIFRKLSADLQFSHKTRMCIASCMAALLKADSACEWAVWQNRGRGDADATRLMDEFPKLLQDSHHGIRLLAAENLRGLFVEQMEKGPRPRPRAEQDQMFDTIYIILTEAMAIEGQYSTDEQHDEAVNRTSSMLHALAQMATSSVICEKKALFAFYQAVRENTLDQDLVTKVLGQVARQMCYPDLLGLMSSRLPYLLTQWLQSGYTLPEFPHRLVGYTSVRDLYTGELKVLVPVLVMRQSLEEVEKVARRLHVDHLDLLKHCLPKVIIHILPHFTQHRAGLTADTQRQHAHATKVYDMVVGAVEKETVEQCIMNHLDEIVVDLLMTFYDSSSNNPQLEQPEPNPPCFSRPVIASTLEYITKGHVTSAKTVVALLAKTHDGIQRVLLSLHQALARAHCLYEKCRVLSMYELFVELLLAEFDTGLGGSFAFVLRDVLFTLLVALQKALPLAGKPPSPLALDFGCSCLRLLENVCNTAVNLGFEATSSLLLVAQHLLMVFPGIWSTTLSSPAPWFVDLGRFLPSMVGILITYAAQENAIGTKSLALLQLLVVDHQVELTPAIRLLAPPPDSAPFRAIRKVHHKIKYSEGPFSLKQELDHFVLAQRSVLAPSGGTLQALTFLHAQLATRKEELAQLVAESKGEDSSPVVAVVSELVHLTRLTDEQLVTGAARCLGELGAANLSTVALTRPHAPQLAGALGKYEDDPKAQQYCHLLHRLDQYLIDPAVDVVTAASQVLKRLLSTKTGVRFYADYNNRMDNAFKYLHPFKASKKKVVTLPEQDRSEEHFLRSVDRVDLWVAETVEHKAWITTLVCALIDSGAVHDEALLVLTDICKVKVEFCEVVLPYLVHDVLLNGADTHRAVLSRHVQAFIAQSSQQGEQVGSRPASPATTSGESVGRASQNQASVRVILSIIQYLRLQNRPAEGKQRTPWDNNFWLDVDYLQVARAASSCSAYFSTLLFAEIWCNLQRETLATKLSSQPSGGSQRSNGGGDGDSQQAQGVLSQLESLSSLPHEGGVSVQELMLDAYRNLGDPDGVYGCGAGKLADTRARIQTYEHEGRWGKAVGAYDVLLSQPAGSSLRVGLMQALQKFGTGHVLDQYLEGLGPGGADGREVRQFQYEAAWRNGHWEQSTPTRFSADCGYQECVYSALWAIKETDTTMLQAATTQARRSCLTVLQESSVESVRSLYPVLSSLQCLTQIDDTAKHITSGDISGLLDKWRLQDPLLHPAYDYIEQPLLQRCRLLQLLPSRVGPSGASGAHDQHVAVVAQLEHFARRSREAGRHQVAERAMAELHRLSRGDVACSWRLEEARLYWARSETDTAKHLMKGLLRRLKTIESGEASALYPRCLGIYGNWLAETRSESPKVIMEDYLVEAVNQLVEGNHHDDSALGAYLSLGRYADVQYQQIVDYMGSPTFEAKQALAKQAKADAQGLRQLGEKQSRYLRTLDKQSAIDEAEVDTMRTDKEHYLRHALANYVKCLTVGDEHDLRIFRITSLWFDNKDNAWVNKQIKAAISHIKSHKFLPLMYQLAARMGAGGSAHGDKLFPATLDRLLERVSTDHPHHSVAIILALANAKKDDDFLPTRGRTKSAGRLSRGGEQQQDDEKENRPPSSSGKPSTMPPPKLPVNTPMRVRLSLPKRVAIAGSRVRVKAAKALISKLKNSPCAGFIADMERLSEAYIELANYDVEKYKKETRPINLPSTLRLTGLKDLRHVGVLTADTKVDPSCEYADLTYLQRFEPTFKLAGGINLPKIICCLGSDGVLRKQLVKGKDDLRQDAVMQQVFGMVNHLLSREAGTKGRHLLVRTYKVIPLSQRSGLLEWCEGTMPFGEYLIGSRTGAHQRYRPQDLSASSCRAELAAAHDPKREKKMSKLEVYRAVCHRFQPVFRHFFMEKFPDPTRWYQRRLAYTRSVATNSIVGYILGLGDRHVQNILIDCKTAELIHIDLGVAFEQGRILPTPETVPFRLTRDVVDGMGITGVEGVYRRCCECTLEVLRGSGEALLTILTVLLYDPLYAWTISPLKAYALQSRRDSRNDPDASYEANTSTSTHDLLEMADGAGSASGSGTAQSESVNKVAERVLLRLRQKLAGHEHGVHLSVSGQVNLLIQEATDPDNLCRLFPGWQPYI